MTAATDTLTRKDALAYLKRFPAQGIAGVAVNLLLVLATNAAVFWLLMDGRLRSAHLVALVALEAVLMILVVQVSIARVPDAHLDEPRKPWRERAPVLAFAAVWLLCAYGLTLVMIDGWRDAFELLRSADAWLDAGLHWPLALTLVTAIVHVAQDHAHYRRHGPPFISTVAHDALARWLTLLLGAIPFAMPFFAVVMGGIKGIEYLLKRAKIAPGQSVLGTLAVLGVAGLGFALVSALISNGVAGWAIGYVLAKLIAEAAVACVPLVMAHVAKEGP